MHMVFIAGEGTKDQDYVGLVDLIRSGESVAHTPLDSPLRDYKIYFSKLSVLEMPSGGLLVFDKHRVFISKHLRTEMVETLHKHHQTVGAMTLIARSYIFWPCLQQNLEEKYNNCHICIMFQNAKDPSIQSAPIASLMQPMESLCADWGCKGKMYYLVFANRSTGFVWGGQFQGMTTDNTIALLKEIIIEIFNPPRS